MIRVRFAPSPTGEMHIGNLRTAIFNWIFAKQNHGKFFIRIEDTDKNRSKTEFFDQIFEILSHIGLDFTKYTEEIQGCQNGVLIQSLRANIYQEYTQKLLDKNHAFFCQCPEDSEICECSNKNFQNGAVRYRVTPNEIWGFKDMVFGDLAINSDSIENFALLRKDGSPTYMLAVVVDDIEMAISHVIRGEDHKTNTFKQLMLYKSFECSPPKFAHLPIIIGSDGKKLSKRNGNTSVKYYLDKGYVPDALFNIILKLGWGSGNEEIISKEKIIEIFSFNDVKKSPARFDEVKLQAFSGKYLRVHDYTKLLKEYLKHKYHFSSDLIDKLYFEVAKRANTFDDCYEQLRFINDKPHCNIKIDTKIIKFFQNYSQKWNQADLLESLREFCNENKLDFKAITSELRQKITGKTFSPDLFLIIECLGKADILSRIISG
jgi:glutamyl-tRNA synthetase